ncbi:LOW QUALITY PROTEIN: hypothetical protein BRARA_I03900 [Brassica rapa]|uniref:Fatty acyl-CoA reductase C-terminal domain-containing protein n=1 Tax=Brassica campestris TaxID=3711 RepID=A0A397Y3C6_BRACM|nr:LOW QUALITY PROTEIN: hypothetical protein BRARA_I03900 [Brassica rapa]
MKLASEALRKFYGREEIKKLKVLAQYYGWENTYTFTKAMVLELERVKFHSSFEDFTSSVSNRIAKQEREMSSGRGESPATTMLSMKGKRKLKYLVSLQEHISPTPSFKLGLMTPNTRSLIQELSMEEKRMFGFNGRDIDWEHYIVNVHLPDVNCIRYSLEAFMTFCR